MSAILAYLVLIVCTILVEVFAYWVLPRTTRDVCIKPLNTDEQP